MTENFYPRPPRGGRLNFAHITNDDDLFLSTPSARRATGRFTSSTVLERYFYPRPPRGGRPLPGTLPYCTGRFLSTPSARRAT